MRAILVVECDLEENTRTLYLSFDTHAHVHTETPCQTRNVVGARISCRLCKQRQQRGTWEYVSRECRHENASWKKKFRLAEENRKLHRSTDRNNAVYREETRQLKQRILQLQHSNEQCARDVGNQDRRATRFEMLHRQCEHERSQCSAAKAVSERDAACFEMLHRHVTTKKENVPRRSLCTRRQTNEAHARFLEDFSKHRVRVWTRRLLESTKGICRNHEEASVVVDWKTWIKTYFFKAIFFAKCMIKKSKKK